MPEPRHGYDNAMRTIGRRAAENGAPITLIDDGGPDLTDRDRKLWREGWRQQKRQSIGLSVV